MIPTMSLCRLERWFSLRCLSHHHIPGHLLPLGAHALLIAGFELVELGLQHSAFRQLFGDERLELVLVPLFTALVIPFGGFDFGLVFAGQAAPQAAQASGDAGLSGLDLLQGAFGLFGFQRLSVFPKPGFRLPVLCGTSVDPNQ